MAKIDLSKMATLLEDVGLDSRTLRQYVSALTDEPSAANFSSEYLDECIHDIHLIARRLSDRFKELETEYSGNLRPILAEMNRLEEQQGIEN